MLRKGETPLQQIARRLKEFDDSDIDTASLKMSINSMRLDKCHYKQDFLHFRKYETQYMILRMPNYLINCKDDKNNCRMLKDGSIINAYSFGIYNSTSYVIGKKLEVLENLYDKPLLSNSLNITVMRYNTFNPLNKWLCSDIIKRCSKYHYIIILLYNYTII